MLRSFIFFAILATLALAAPTSNRALKKRSFTVPRVRSSSYVPDPTTAMAKAFRKFGWQFTVGGNQNAATGTAATNITGHHHHHHHHHHNTTAAASVSANSNADTSTFASAAAAASAGSGDDTSEVAATAADNGAEYLAPVTISGQQLNLDFDTGSADLWVFSDKLPSSETSGHTVFSSAKSSSFKQLNGATFNIAYGDGSGAAGIVGTDTVKIGDATVTTQAVELATAVSSSFVSDADSDGLVGLGFSNINSVQPTSQKTWFDNIMNDLEQPLFTADLSVKGASTYEFGTIDTSKYTGELSTVAIDSSNGYWEFQSNTYSIGGQTYKSTSSSPAIADTGTSLVLVDPHVAAAYYAQISGAQNDDSVGGYVYPCNADIPAFGMGIGDFMAMVPSASVTFAEVDSSTCFGGIQSNGGSGLQIYGDVMFENNFVVFNGGNVSLSIAAKA